MTDRPERPTTIVPPEDTSATEPPADRDKPTDRPIPRDSAPPDDLVNLADRVFTRLHTLEESCRLGFAKVDQLYAILVGTPDTPGGKAKRNIVTELHDLSGHVAVAGSNAELVAEQQKTLPKLIAQEVANRVFELFQGELRAQNERLEALEARLEELHEMGPNGRGNTR